MHGVDQWVSIMEAARRLGLSPATVRRRIKLGELEGELQPGRRGPEYRVRLPSDTLDATHETTDETIHESPDATHDALDSRLVLTELLRLEELHRADLAAIRANLDAARAELLIEARAAAEWRTRAELVTQQSELHQQHAQRLERRVEELRAELDRARRPWWRKLLG
jgi:hypothetical protein